MTIVGATWADLGYRKLGPSPRLDAGKTNVLADLVSRYGLHEVQTAGDERWIRDNHRRSGVAAPWALRHLATITPTNVGAEDTYEFLERATETRYAQVQRRVTSTWDDLVSLARKPESQEPRLRSLHALASAVSLCSPDALAALLRIHALPAFFASYPAGRVLFFQSNYEFETRYGLLRGLYSTSHYELTELDPNAGFRALRQWQTLDTVTQPRTLMTLLGVALYPLIHVVTAGPIGLRMVFVLDPPERHELPPFPASWMSIAQSHWDFGDQERDHMAVLGGTDGDATAAAAHGRYRTRAAFSAEDVATTVTWFAERFSSLAFHLADPCEFLLDDCIDPVTCFEYALTVDRVMRKAISCVASEETAVRKGASQEIADLLETLRCVWDPAAGNSAYFKRLYHPVDGAALLAQAFDGVPEPFRQHLLTTSRQLYDELQAAIRASVWVPAKVTTNGVLVKSRDLTGEREEPLAEFTSNVVRALRNAHHGYLTRSDPGNRPSRYLALVSGDTPDSMSHLGVLWALALLASPQAMLAFQPMPLAAWP